MVMLRPSNLLLFNRRRFFEFFSETQLVPTLPLPSSGVSSRPREHDGHFYFVTPSPKNLDAFFILRKSHGLQYVDVT